MHNPYETSTDASGLPKAAPVVPHRSQRAVSVLGVAALATASLVIPAALVDRQVAILVLIVGVFLGVVGLSLPGFEKVTSIVALIISGLAAGVVSLIALVLFVFGLAP